MEGATASDLVASKDEVDRVVTKVIPGNLGVAVSALEKELQGKDF